MKRIRKLINKLIPHARPISEQPEPEEECKLTKQQIRMLQVAYLSRAACMSTPWTQDAIAAVKELESMGLVSIGSDLCFVITLTGIDYIERHRL